MISNVSPPWHSHVIRELWMVLPLNVWKDWYISDCVTDTGGGSSWGTPTFKKRKTKGLVNIQSAIQRIRVTGQGVIPTEKSKDEMTVKYSAGFLLNISNWARKKKHIYMTMQWLHNECEKEILVISQVHGRLADMPKKCVYRQAFHLLRLLCKVDA